MLRVEVEKLQSCKVQKLRSEERSESAKKGAYNGQVDKEVDANGCEGPKVREGQGEKRATTRGFHDACGARLALTRLQASRH